jgi:predicted O-methyltransferase YrrM
MVRTLAPARIVEIGSGHSTRFMARAIADGALATMLTAIDPAPRAAIRALPIRHIGGTIPPRDAATAANDGASAGNAAMGAIRPLAAGDILFVDSSHILVPGSDVDFLLNRVLPALPAGAILHIHDILLPDPYPREWDWYGYNEQNAVLPLLLGGTFKPLFASHYVATRMADALGRSAVASLPQEAGAIPASLWLEKLR